MLCALLVLVTLQNLVAALVISVPNGETWGNWGAMEVCDGNTVARGFQLKVEKRQGPLDDSALNGIAIHCTKDSSREVVKIIRSTVGDFGSWGPVFWCNSRAFLKNFMLRVESVHTKDSTAANNIEFTCSDGSIIEGNGQSWGTYGVKSPDCEKGIRGIQTRVQEKQGALRDDVALTDVKFLCRNE
ncbi:Vitelline membrane outer layer protein I (VOMI), partial [Pristimantis euphronides]